MIGQLEGHIWQANERFIILGVSGVGYKIALTKQAVSELPADRTAVIRIWTHLSVREDALELYGFTSENELALFEMIIGISGIGPKKAIAILSLAPATTLIRSIARGDTQYLTNVSGIGRKNAEKIVLELRDKMLALAADEPGTDMQDETDVIEALKMLGHSAHEARKALAQVPPTVTGVANRIKAAMKQLGSTK